MVYEDKELEHAKKCNEEIGEMKGVYIPSRRPNVREKVETNCGYTTGTCQTEDN